VFPANCRSAYGQVRVADRDDEAPVLADRAALHPGHDEIYFLELDARNPDSREQVTLAAPDDGIGGQVVAETPPDEGCPTTTTATIGTGLMARRDISSI